MSEAALGPPLPWTHDERAERRFSAILLAVLVPLLLIGLLMPFLPLLDMPEEPEEEEVPQRIAELVIEQRKPEPQPKPEPRPVEPEAEPEPAPEPEPQRAPEPQTQPQPERQQPTARERAAQSGVLAFSKELETLRQNDAASRVRSQRDLIRSETDSSAPRERQAVDSNYGQGSSGIDTQASTPTRGPDTQIAGRQTTRVPGRPGTRGPAAGGSQRGSGRGAVRTNENIQLVFDRNKGSLYSLYQRALRENPTLQGTLVLQLTIQPSGEVTDVSVASSELDDPALEQKIVNRVKLFDFGAKDVPVWRGRFPIKFFPS